MWTEAEKLTFFYIKNTTFMSNAKDRMEAVTILSNPDRKCEGEHSTSIFLSNMKH